MISVTILTKNSQRTLKKTLQSLLTFPEVLIYDSGSTDNTLEIARLFPNVTIYQGEFEGFGIAHNKMSELAKHDWILSIDSDEELSPALCSEIHELDFNENVVYRLNRLNMFNGKKMKCCSGWYPDPVVRLYHRKKTSFTTNKVHEKVAVDKLEIIDLSQPLYHTPYLAISDFLDKMQHYSTLFSEEKKGKTVSVSKALLHSWYAFFKSYILKRGFLGGKEGLIISMYNGHTAFYKYLKLLEIKE